MQRDRWGRRRLVTPQAFQQVYRVPAVLQEDSLQLQLRRDGNVLLTAKPAAPAAEAHAETDGTTTQRDAAGASGRDSPIADSPRGKLAAALRGVKSPAEVQYRPTPVTPAQDPDVLLAEDAGDMEDLPFLQHGAEGGAEAASGYMFRGEWHEY